MFVFLVFHRVLPCGSVLVCYAACAKRNKKRKSVFEWGTGPLVLQYTCLNHEPTREVLRYCSSGQRHQFRAPASPPPPTRRTKRTHGRSTFRSPTHARDVSSQAGRVLRQEVHHFFFFQGSSICEFLKTCPSQKLTWRKIRLAATG